MTEASLSPFLCHSPKKEKVICLRDLQVFYGLCVIAKGVAREPQLSTVFGGKSKCRFLAIEKTPDFTKIQCENVGKSFSLFALF